jgi:tripartite-type tricarboxylate transporter receptor subunit TctC
LFSPRWQRRPRRVSRQAGHDRRPLRRRRPDRQGGARPRRGDEKAPRRPDRDHRERRRRRRHARRRQGRARAPDGYTLLLHHIGISTAPALYRTLPYKTLDDFEYVGMINEVPMTLIGKPTLPANNYAELLKWMEANKGKINLANAGLGAASHLCGLLLQSTLKIDMQTVPYKGTAPAMNDLLGGQVDIMCDQTTNTTGQIEAGKVKAFAVTSSKRLTTPALKNLPTLDEAGLKGFNVNIWHGLYAPKGTPKAVTDKLNAALRTALKDPDFIKREEALGAVIITDARLGGAEHKKFVADEIAKWSPVIKAAGQYAD